MLLLAEKDVFDGVLSALSPTTFLLISTFSMRSLGYTSEYLVNYKIFSLVHLPFLIDFNIDVVRDVLEWFLWN